MDRGTGLCREERSRGRGFCEDDGGLSKEGGEPGRTRILAGKGSESFYKEKMAGPQSGHPLKIKSNESWEKVIEFDHEEVTLDFSFGKKVTVEW